MMSNRFCLVLVLVALACSALVTEGRLFDPSSAAEEQPGGEEQPEATTNKTLSTKFANFVNASKLGDSMCAHIHPEELPEECSCREPGKYSLVIECLKTFNSTYFNDTIGMKIDLDPCNEEGAKLSLDVTEKEHDIEYPIAGIRAGESKNIPIPGA
jgi:hypothetical protein